MKDEPSSSPTTATTTVKAKPAKRGKRTYTVRAGDTLSAIAARTHVPLERLQELNPDIDVNTLNTGQRLKLRPSS
jgi:LysM repeat protein